LLAPLPARSTSAASAASPAKGLVGVGADDLVVAKIGGGVFATLLVIAIRSQGDPIEGIVARIIDVTQLPSSFRPPAQLGAGNQRERTTV
jgi:hypothetical protein